MRAGVRRRTHRRPAAARRGRSENAVASLATVARAPPLSHHVRITTPLPPVSPFVLRSA